MERTGRARTPLEGFQFCERGPVRLWVASELQHAVNALGLDSRSGLERALSEARGRGGRGRNAVLELAGTGRRLHLRPLRHGGLLAPLWRDRFLGVGRPLAELAANARLEAAGVPVPTPVLVATLRRAGPLYSAAFGTLHIDDGIDAAAFLAGDPGGARSAAAAAACGAAVRKLHAAGARHPDLHVGNLLLRFSGSRPEAFVLDLDGVRLGAAPTPRERASELARLVRSLVKRGLAERVGRRGCARFLAAYVDGDRALRRALRAELPRARTHVALHSIGYRLRRAQPSGAHS